MPLCEHFIYTAAKTNVKVGYQIIAKSEGVNDRILNNMTGYMYPLGINPIKFIKSKSLLPLGKELVAYSVVKNIGVGHDGRDGTLYNHTIIMNTKDFAKIEYDTRILDKYFIEEYSIRGKMNQLHIQPEKLKIDFEYLKKIDNNFLNILLFYLFKKNRIAILKTTDQELIQNILPVIPPQIRSVAFSTLILDPVRQSKYHLIQIPNNTQTKLQTKYVSINLDALPSSKIKFTKNAGIQNIIKLINQNNEEGLVSLHNDFEKITTQVSKTKRVKIRNMFNKEKFEELAENKKFYALLNNIKNLYSNPDFNRAPSKTILATTKKIKKIINKSMKEYEKNNLDQSDFEKLMLIFKILLDCLNYVERRDEMKIEGNVQLEIKILIKDMTSILKRHSQPDSIGQEYEFNSYDYLKNMYENALESMHSMALFWLGRQWW